MSFPVVVVNVPVHSGTTALEFALKDITKPIEIAVSGRKIPTACFERIVLFRFPPGNANLHVCAFMCVIGWTFEGCVVHVHA